MTQFPSARTQPTRSFISSLADRGVKSKDSAPAADGTGEKVTACGISRGGAFVRSPGNQKSLSSACHLPPTTCRLGPNGNHYAANPLWPATASPSENE